MGAVAWAMRRRSVSHSDGAGPSRQRSGEANTALARSRLRSPRGRRLASREEREGGSLGIVSGHHVELANALSRHDER